MVIYEEKRGTLQMRRICTERHLDDLVCLPVETFVSHTEMVLDITAALILSFE